MERDNKKYVLRAFLIYVAVNLVTYALAHIEYLFMNDTVGEILAYLNYYVSKTVEFIAPPVIATLVLLAYAKGGIKPAIVTAFSVSSARLIYALPYYYLIFVYNYRYDSVEAICLSFGASALVVLFTAAGSLVCLGAAVIVLKKKGVRTSEQISSLVDEHVDLNYLANASLPITVFVLMRFGFSLIKELVDTVSFFIEYVADYTATEIITMLLNYVLLFALLVVSYLICTAIKNAIMKTNVPSDKK